MFSAMMAWDIQQSAPGRFTLGLGSQVKGHNIRRFSVPWSPPAPRMNTFKLSVQYGIAGSAAQNLTTRVSTTSSRS